MLVPSKQQKLDLEVPIAYSARTEAQGKKIKWTDAFDAFSALLRYRFSRDY